MEAMTPAMQIAHLSFGYPGQSAPGQSAVFADFALDIDAGRRFGLFGPNGAGKTTLMNLMTGLLAADAGSIRLFGQDVKKHPRSINALFGLVPQDYSFYQELTPVENLAFFGAWAGMSGPAIKTRTGELLEILGLTEVRNKRVLHFSGGMKRRVNLAIGVVHRPPLLFLDEPTVGVDVQTRHAIVHFLKTLNAQENTTLVYTSHQLNEAEDLCDRIALIDQGRIIAHDDLGPLLLAHRQEGLEGLFLHLTGKNYRNL
jgi:ABC-2 type transport system ATP-binding protein